MSQDTRKPVFRVCDQLRLKLACSADETSKGLEISAVSNRGIIPSRQRTTKELIRLRELLFAYGLNRSFHDVAHISVYQQNFKTKFSVTHLNVG